MKQEKKCDRRVVKTKKAIRNAFIVLLEEKDINDITVTDIAQAAEVDRKTVYNYYSGVYAIQEEIESDCVSQLSRVLDEIGQKPSIDDPYYIFQRITEVLNQNIDFYSRLLKGDANSHIVRKITRVIQEKLKEALMNSPAKDSPKLDMMSEYITSGMVAAYQSWFNSPRTQTLESFSQDVGRLVIAGVQGFFKA